MLSRNRNANPSFAIRRIMQNQVTSRYASKNYKMIHIPMENCRQLQLAKILEVQSQGSAGEMQILSNFDEAFECDPLQGYGVAAAESAEIHTVAVVTGYHGQACKATLGSFRLKDQRDSAEVHITPLR
jgi:hypothetical protein